MRERLRVAAGLLVLLAAAFSLTSTPAYRSVEPSSNLRGGVQGVMTNQSTELARIVRVPDDMKWLVPEREGWLCDYEHVQNENQSWALRIVLRGTGVGMLMVFPGRSVARPEEWSTVYREASFSNRFGDSRQEILIDNRWVVVAVNYWGVAEAQFAYVAHFGDSRAVTRGASSFQIGQLIEYAPVELYNPKLASKGFPGISGANEILLAFKQLRLQDYY